MSVAVCAGAAYVTWGRFSDAKAAAGEPAVFTGYVDVTATPTYAFEAPVSTAAKSVVLSFIVAAQGDRCEPSWGNAYSLAQAEKDLDLDRRVARLRQQSGTISVSFGGAANSELALACTDQAKLQAAYAAVVERYDLSSIDLDLEGAGLSDTAAMARRVGAIAALQAERQREGKSLDVWLTLPADTSGLTAGGRGAVTAFLAGRVDLAGVNLMTMDFGASKPDGTSMLNASIGAAQAGHEQLGSIYKAAGDDLGPDLLWRKIGLTPMIGQNDVTNEVFTLADATGLNEFADSKGIGRISMWSLNRDATCGPNYPDLTRVSDACSGINQNGTLFSTALGTGLLSQAPSTPAASGAPTVLPTQAADNPATSPYPIWNVEAVYVGRDQIVWHGNVYQAKWWTQGDVPDNPAATDGTSPWQLIGPVLPGDKPAPVVTAPAGTYPLWSATATYVQGDHVMFDGRIFVGKWWTRDDNPLAALQGSPTSPWTMFSNAQVQQLLDAKAAK